MSESESPAQVPDDQPNPVLVGPGLKALKKEAYADATNATPDNVSSEEAPSYFNIGAVTDTSPARESSGMELLRRLSLTSDTPMSPEIDPRVQYPGLRLSGRLISAAFCIPYKLSFRTGSSWVSVLWQRMNCRLTSTDAQVTLRYFSTFRFVCTSCIG